MSRRALYEAAAYGPSATPDRREAMKLLWAGAAAALAGCGRPREEIIPYTEIPAGLEPGQTQRYATTLDLGGYGRGVRVTAVDGRPIRIEGNPNHPASLGATDVFAEAAVLDLFDPFRSKVASGPQGVSAWSAFERALRGRLQIEGVDGGKGLALLTGRVVSPTQLRQIAALKARFPAMIWARYEPAHDDAARRGARLAYGRELTLLPRLGEADVGLWLGADPLGPGPAQIANARAYSGRRRQAGPPARWYAAEPCMTLSGAAADHRLAASPADLAGVAAEIAGRLGAFLPKQALAPEAAAFAAAVSADLQAAPGRALVLAGPVASPEVHALAAWINTRVRAPIDAIAPLDPLAEDHAVSIAGLVARMGRGEVRTLIVLDANPAYDAPDPESFATLLARVPFSAHLGLYRDETGRACRWHAPLSHTLEIWSDARAVDGTASLVQPLVRPLYDSRSAPEALAVMIEETADDPRDLVRRTWKDQAGADADGWWKQALVAGVIEGSASQRQPLPEARPPTLKPRAAGGLTLVTAPHASLWDGRLAANAWLQECPEPFTKEVWGAALGLAPADAARLGVTDGQSVKLTVNGRTVEAAARIKPGQATGVVSLPLGLGRREAGPIGTGVGVSVAALRGPTLAFSVAGASLEKGGKAKAPPVSQLDTSLAGEAHALLPTLTHADLAARRPAADPPTELTQPAGSEHAWAMVIDTDACIGCNACVVACQTENNVPAVGPGDAAMGRDMHWLRIDVYDTGHPENARPGFEPVPCMQCEQAPCEPVCPVEASVHDHEGLNDQVYNRCVGTRFCQSNCPYKVRRFNFHDYQSGALWDGLDTASIKALRNPEVSVRARGVMEKCTYCVQRLSAARRESEKNGQPIADDAVTTACQSACPTRAISFGDLNDPASKVRAHRADPRHFTLLQEYGTRPRTTYLARLHNPHPDLEGKA
jgi:Fe-S-cluster-containing dehydrogenase component